MSGDDEYRERGKQEPNTPNRWTRDQKLATIGIIVALIVGGATAFISLQSGSGSDTGSAASRSGTTAASTPSRSTPAQPQTAPQPTVNPNATCATVRDAAEIGEPRPRRIFVSSPGELGGGPSTMEARLLSNKQWTAWLHVQAGEEVELSVKLFDGDYDSVDNARILVRIVEHADNCWRLGGAMRYATDYGHPTPLGPLLLQLQSGQHATKLTYVPHSSRLLDKHDKELTKLPDGVLDAGVPLPFSVPPAALDIYFVNFRLKVS
ncbi:MAG TPA: hypothetical protein VGP18_04245 [Solirubrobacteraceae bacterium]|jgi:hypothetical protein|nr:hypothetical protein [Solirubrobacteraceae bacterium]